MNFISLGKKTEKGYIVMMSVILLGAIGLVIASSLILIGLTFSGNNLASRQSLKANALANACAESALNSIVLDSSYLGNEVLSLGDGSCNILPVSQNASIYTIDVTGTVSQVVKNFSVVAEKQDGPPVKMQIISWQEVEGF